MTLYEDEVGSLLYQGKCETVLRKLEANSVHALVTDPPAGIKFMGKAWDGDKGGRDKWIAWLTGIMQECHRILMPGAHALVWALPRTSHWTAMALEDAGFEVRDVLTHLFASGRPKMYDVSKAIDKQRHDDIRPVCRFLRAAMDANGLKSRNVAERFGFHSRMVDHWAARDTDSQPTLPTLEQWAQLKELLELSDEMDAEVERFNARKGTLGDDWQAREVTGQHEHAVMRGPCGVGRSDAPGRERRDAPATEAAAQWVGYGTGLKPASEHWILVRKRFTGTTVANVLEHGVGAINIDGTRIGTDWSERSEAWKRSGHSAKPDADKIAAPPGVGIDCHPLGRYPANLLLSHSSIGVI